MATGLGKTYLAAFFAAQFERVLFIAHREEILIKAQQSFKHVHPTKGTGFYNAKEKAANADFVFASIQTLNQQHHLSGFAPDTFDLIVVDEFHHASAPSYMRILDYFKPEFLLGITATPYRLDNKDVFGLCDGNVAISIHFIDAIKQQWLVPFRYYGIYDDTDYSQLRWLGNRYDEEELARVQLRTDMAEKIFQEWIKHKQSRTIAFCSSILQADFLNHHFQQAGFLSISLNGNTPNEERLAARERLNSGKLDIIFTVDLFNEGVDIPRVDTLLFVRPTESLAVFTQQIGRGLRIAEDKDDCVIIDLIGNYRNADMKWGVFNPMPMTMWGGSAKTVSYEDKIFKLNFDIAQEDRSIVYEWTRQICEYRLHTYFEKKSIKI